MNIARLRTSTLPFDRKRSLLPKSSVSRDLNVIDHKSCEMFTSSLTFGTHLEKLLWLSFRPPLAIQNSQLVMSSSTTKQPKHRVSIPAKSALKSGPSKSQSKRPAGDEDNELVIIKKRTTPSSKKASRNNKKDDEEEGLSDLSDGADGEDEFDVNGMEVDEEEGSSDEEGDISTDEEIEGMKADRKKSKKNTS
jgi:hypothetical protein